MGGGQDQRWHSCCPAWRLKLEATWSLVSLRPGKSCRGLCCVESLSGWDERKTGAGLRWKETQLRGR